MQASKWSSHWKKGMLLMGLVALSLAMACSFIGGDSEEESETAAKSPSGVSTQAKKSTPTPEPKSEPEVERRWAPAANTSSSSVSSSSVLNPLQPTPAPNPEYLRSSAQVEEIAWHEIRSCADQLNATLGNPLLVGFDSSFSQSEGIWHVDAFSIDPSLSLGNWLVIDATGEVIANDALAQDIATRGNSCDLPESELATGRTAPRVGEPVSITEPQLAAATVWETVYRCYGEQPDISRFPARRTGATDWVVGRSADTRYGQWSLDATTAQVSPLTETARQAEGMCSNSLASITASRASLRVWMATYECFTPRPDLEDYQTFQENPRQWIVEAKDSASGLEAGSSIVVAYGLWTVDADTGEIEPWDSLAEETAKKTCFKSLD